MVNINGYDDGVHDGFHNNLVGGWPISLKMMEWKSLGMMTFPSEWNVIKVMFQTTNQIKYLLYAGIMSG